MGEPMNNCVLCRVMRAMAFSGFGMGVGALLAYLLGASRQTMAMTGLFAASLLVLGLMDKK